MKSSIRACHVVHLIGFLYSDYPLMKVLLYRDVDNYLELGGQFFLIHKLLIFINICAFSVQTQSWPWQLVQYCIGLLSLFVPVPPALTLPTN